MLIAANITFEIEFIRKMVSGLLETTIGDTRNTILVLFLVPIMFAIHWLRPLNEDCTGLAQTIERKPSIRHMAENNDRVATARFGDDHDPNQYTENMRELEDELLQDEVVEITFDLGGLGENVTKFLSRMHRAMI